MTEVTKANVRVGVAVGMITLLGAVLAVGAGYGPLPAAVKTNTKAINSLPKPTTLSRLPSLVEDNASRIVRNSDDLRAIGDKVKDQSAAIKALEAGQSRIKTSTARIDEHLRSIDANLKHIARAIDRQ